MLNMNYYDGLNPLARIRAAAKRATLAANKMGEARRSMVGTNFPDLSGQWEESACKFINRSCMHSSGFGLNGDFWLSTKESSGAVDGYFLELIPETLLEITEFVENRVDDICRHAEIWCECCARISAMALIRAEPALIALSGTSEVASRLRKMADTLEKATNV